MLHNSQSLDGAYKLISTGSGHGKEVCCTTLCGQPTPPHTTRAEHKYRITAQCLLAHPLRMTEYNTMTTTREPLVHWECTYNKQQIQQHTRWWYLWSVVSQGWEKSRVWFQWNWRNDAYIRKGDVKSSNSLIHAHTVCTTHLCQGDPAWAAARSEWRRGGPPYWPWPAVARNGGDGASAAHPSTCE